MGDQIKLIRGYQWIVYHPDLLGGQPTVKGTRISVSQVLECLSVGMTPADIAEDYEGFPIEAISEVFKFAAHVTHKPFSDDLSNLFIEGPK